MSYRVAVVKWNKYDGIADAIVDELRNLGHHPVTFHCAEDIPTNVHVVISFAPYGRFIQIPERLNCLPANIRPFLIHWDTEGFLNPRIPWKILRAGGEIRSWFGRQEQSDDVWLKKLFSIKLIRKFNTRLNRLRYFGDYIYSTRRGWIDKFAIFSEYYAHLYRHHGIPAIFVPWGTVPSWCADLELVRDIDVLWMGQWQTTRRRRLFNDIRYQLELKGKKVYVADNIENPFIYGEKRLNILNRTKIIINLLPYWYFNNFVHRFHLAAGNKSMVITEPLFPHCSSYISNYHYVESSLENFVNTILYYLDHEGERNEIVSNAYELATMNLTFNNSVRLLMENI